MIVRLIGLILLTIGMAGCTGEPPYNNLNSEQLQTLLTQGTPIYDIRRPEEWRETGVVSGSRLLTFVDGGGRVLPDFLPRFTADIDKNEPVILICRTGSRTRALAGHLVEQMGYTQVYNVRDGITGWISDDQPVTRL